MKAKGIKQSDKIKEQWDEYTDENYLTLKSYSVGSHLVSTEWGQENGYNRFCPSGCPAGCSAVAMAQVLWYWQCRIVSGWGSYNWDLMGESVANDHNALLIYHCGLACDTDYGPSGSTSTPNKIKNGLDDHMGCKSDVNVVWQNSHLFNWRDWLEDEIDAERPIIYNAGNFEFAGHSWVIDGYDSVGKFYCNWGYDGVYNGWFSLGDFEIPIGSWNTFDSAVIKIIPEQDNGVGTPQIPAYNFTYNPNGYGITIPEVFGATSYEWTTNHGTITGTGTTANLKSDCSATVQVRAFNNHCEVFSAYATGQVTINYGPISGPSTACSSGNTFTIANLPPAVNSIVWTPGPGLTISSGQNTASCTFSATGNVISWVKAMLVLDCGNITLTPKEIIAGSVRPGTISYEMDAPPGRFSTFIDDVPTATSYNWYLNGVKNNTYHGTSAVFPRKSPFCGVSYRVEVEAINPCGTSGKTLLDIFEPSCFYSLLLSPNPTTTESTLELFNESDAIMESDMEWDLEVYSPNQLLKMKKLKLKGKAYKINTSGWEDGVFIVRVKIDDQVLSEKLVVKH